MKWKRVTDFGHRKNNIEQWIYEYKCIEKSLDVSVTFGKPIDIVSLKERTQSDLKSHIKNIKQSREKIFLNTTEKTLTCPICGSDSSNSTKKLEVYKASYVQCKLCSHCYVIDKPSKQQLEEFYANNKQYQSTYTDKDSLQNRIDEVVVPKLEYIIREYENIYGRKPQSILDVGAGSGHFLKACNDKGIEAKGIEISNSGRLFCKENFDIEMYDKDFIESWNEFDNYDIITFWGVIEHVPYPLEMLKAARKALSGREGLVVVEVPRWESFGTGVQQITPDTIIRHLDPLGHINCFTDSSLSTAFIKSSFDIRSAWYFGMDMYELVTQWSYIYGDNKLNKDIEGFISQLQESLDMGRLSDTIVLLGTPT